MNKCLNQTLASDPIEDYGDDICDQDPPALRVQAPAQRSSDGAGPSRAQHKSDGAPGPSRHMANQGQDSFVTFGLQPGDPRFEKIMDDDERESLSKQAPALDRHQICSWVLPSTKDRSAREYQEQCIEASLFKNTLITVSE